MIILKTFVTTAITFYKKKNKATDKIRALFNDFCSRASLFFYCRKRIYITFYLIYICFFYIGVCMSANSFMLYNFDHNGSVIQISPILFLLYISGFTIFGKLLSLLILIAFSFLTGYHTVTNVSSTMLSTQFVLTSVCSFCMILLTTEANLYSQKAEQGISCLLRNRGAIKYSLIFN